jgi:hypothetical protein
MGPSTFEGAGTCAGGSERKERGAGARPAPGRAPKQIPESESSSTSIRSPASAARLCRYSSSSDDDLDARKSTGPHRHAPSALSTADPVKPVTVYRASSSGTNSIQTLRTVLGSSWPVLVFAVREEDFGGAAGGWFTSTAALEGNTGGRALRRRAQPVDARASRPRSGARQTSRAWAGLSSWGTIYVAFSHPPASPQGY